MSNPETHMCPTCGYVWIHGKNGSHNCNVLLLARIENLELELKRSKEISKRQGEITAVNMEDFIELTDELKEANTEIDAYKFNLQGERSAVREVSDMLVSSENKLKEANAAIKCMNEIGVEPYDSKEQNQLKKHQKAIDRALKES